MPRLIVSGIVEFPLRQMIHALVRAITETLIAKTAIAFPKFPKAIALIKLYKRLIPNQNNLCMA
ncbi:hypothetical protein PQG02_35985 (plasmid) [Nostoc sp. UHCC 0926]|uniref:hypothetical protein n=1 Tax=Nostoc sp. UHCC 0926 TaxID=3025190 RepID=UPI0023615EA2|nr:hypothetical protein [Nostoc sp. UHCC 0926]WDD36541.1 hypothetical protein PQG02_35985 [Nostoc sp. UHCC 0926]